MSRVDFTRLRRGELVAGVSGALLLVFLFVPDWYSLNGPFGQTMRDLGGRTSWDGWWGLSAWRYPALLTILLALALPYYQAATRAPAMPVTLAVLMTVFGVLTTIGLIFRIAAGPPSGGAFLHQGIGPYLALVASLGIVYGGYASMREEAGADPEAIEIETVRLRNEAGS